MDSADLNAFTAETREAVIAAFGLAPELRLLSDWHALTFAGVQRGRECVCRITPRSHRSPAAIEAELEWQSFVGASGRVKVPAILASTRGNRLEQFEAGSTSFTAVVFEHLGGRPVAPADWNAALFAEWGRLVGDLHTLSRGFRPAKVGTDWHDSDFLNVDRYIPDSEPLIKANALAVIGQVKAIPREPRTFGVIHGDVYQDNFLIGRSGLELFDFDNTERGFYVSDIAVAVYAALWRTPEGETQQEFATRFWPEFLRGYDERFSLGADQWALLPLFLKLREILIYIVARKKRDPAHLSPKAKAWFDQRAGRIAQGEPIVRLEP